MNVGVLQFFAWPDRRVPIGTVYERVLERIEIMDRAGYAAVWLAEHHFQSFSVCPSIHMMATAVAARTRRIRIGTAVSLAAFYHPLRLAEEVALLDVLSGGRVNWGAGRGFHRREFEIFGVAPEESAARFRVAQRAAHVCGPLPLIRRRRGASQAPPATAPAGVAGRVVRRFHHPRRA